MYHLPLARGWRSLISCCCGLGIHGASRPLPWSYIFFSWPLQSWTCTGVWVGWSVLPSLSSRWSSFGAIQRQRASGLEAVVGMACSRHSSRVPLRMPKSWASNYSPLPTKCITMFEKQCCCCPSCQISWWLRCGDTSWAQQSWGLSPLIRSPWTDVLAKPLQTWFHSSFFKFGTALIAFTYSALNFLVKGIISRRCQDPPQTSSHKGFKANGHRKYMPEWEWFREHARIKLHIWGELKEFDWCLTSPIYALIFCPVWVKF